MLRAGRTSATPTKANAGRHKWRSRRGNGMTYTGAVITAVAGGAGVSPDIDYLAKAKTPNSAQAAKYRRAVVYEFKKAQRHVWDNPPSHPPLAVIQKEECQASRPYALT
jgi:hypothetical protein